ncbi:PREDICTED: protein ALWAYS EARLY 2-like [Tarenaya hassleriana]|uniref:protein ALWAYS EARLY 2-like n=1 Tax=Tarenaya hassleriana TaxID=28532 RepID=UPI00053C2D18|nr:PREDICTED: protein ALWAYS EARLY 2-like [Tarenaya hassleriana]XP_019058705.1 PREDICTED: protein ALWAYS EARLY 2-like [Tarenaya hassleriana]
MAPSRKSRSVNKRFSNEASPEKDVGNSSKSKQMKKKLSDNLGPQWTKGELERFYDAYRKHGLDWRKVAAAVRNNRSVEMVEALFCMNRAYLSLPEGTASVAGLIAMMTDHYSVMDGSDSEAEGHDASGVPRKYQKRKHAHVQFSESREEANPSHSFASTDGCLLFLKEAQDYGSWRRATGKRTPRFPVPRSYRRDDREGSTPPSKRARKLVDNDDVAHLFALTLTEASKRGGSEPPYRRTEHSDSSPIKSLGETSQAREAQSKLRGCSKYEEWVEGNREKKHETGVSDRDATSFMDMEVVGTLEALQGGKNVKAEEVEGNDCDEKGEACSASEELRSKSQQGKVDVEGPRGKYSPRCLKKRNKKLHSKDEFEALQALLKLSTSTFPVALMESESAARIKDERTANNMDEKSSAPEATSTSPLGRKSTQDGAEENALNAISAVENTNYRKPKSLRQASADGSAGPAGNQQQQPTSGTSRRRRKPKVLDAEPPKNSNQNKSTLVEESVREENAKSVVRTKRSGQAPAEGKQLKTAKTLEESSPAGDKKRPDAGVTMSTIPVSASGPATLPQKPPNRRKVNLKKMLQERVKFSETTSKAPHSDESLSEHELLQEKLSTCLSNPLARRRCIFEWFYSAIDYLWFTKMEFMDYLNHVGLGHIPRLARFEWNVIKSSLGRPRRFSERFLQEERDKLQHYRETVRKHYTDLRAGVTREGLPADLARPLSVGNKVIAIHPKTREIQCGKILTVDHNKCSVLFDRDDLGAEFVMDIDCMPSNPLEYMPEGLRRHISKGLPISKEAQLNRHPNSGGSVMLPSNGLENATFSMNPPLQQGDTNGQILLGKISTTNPTTVQQATNNQPYTTTCRKAKELVIQQALAMQHTSIEKEKEPEMLEIFKGSKSRAQAMVDAAVKAACSVIEGEDKGKKIQEAIDSMGKHQPLPGSMVPGVKHQEHANGSLDHLSQSPSETSPPLVNGSISQNGSEKNEDQMPSELISSCVATWLMIQTCTERQYPPADVAQLIDTAVTSLHPKCPQNLPIYREIQTCMGRIKTQILALVPT